MVILLVIFISNSLRKLESTNKWLEHTNEVITNGYQALKLIIDLENSQRGYLITGGKEFLEPFNLGERNLENKIITIKKLVSGNEEQVKRITKIKRLVDHYTNCLEKF